MSSLNHVERLASDQLQSFAVHRASRGWSQESLVNAAHYLPVSVVFPGTGVPHLFQAPFPGPCSWPFFILVFSVYWLTPSCRLRKWWLLACSYTFYATWDDRFLSLILTLVDFQAVTCGLISAETKTDSVGSCGNSDAIFLRSTDRDTVGWPAGRTFRESPQRQEQRKTTDRMSERSTHDQ